MNPTNLDLAALRSLLLSPAPDRHPALVDLGGGATVEVRDPLYADIDAMNRLYKDRALHGTIYMVTVCTYKPGTNDRVFTAADVNDFLNLPVGGWLGRLMDVVGSKVKAATDLGNSPSPTPPSPSST